MTYVALLRGINVGGNRKVDMKHLRATFKRAGMDDVRTYINSGNVIFSTDATDTAQLVHVLESAIESAFGFPVPVFLRDADTIRALVEALPEHWVNGKGAKCDVLFLSDKLDSEEILEQLTIKLEIDDVRYFPAAVLWGVDRSMVTRRGMTKLIGTELYANMTLRNCNTVRKLDELSAGLPSPGS